MGVYVKKITLKTIKEQFITKQLLEEVVSGLYLFILLQYFAQRFLHFNNINNKKSNNKILMLIILTFLTN